VTRIAGRTHVLY